MLMLPIWHVTAFLPMCCITGYFFINALGTRGRSPAVSAKSAQRFAEDDGELTTIS
ncbi:MAG TPA: hypothetical protein VJS11_15060 [Acidobacteriaceae bacterium]|nr:hypothetical protein [Acidobacteriaceae bacterium]